MNLEEKICNEIEKATIIELREENLKGKGSFGEVYLHEIAE